MAMHGLVHEVHAVLDILNSAAAFRSGSMANSYDTALLVTRLGLYAAAAHDAPGPEESERAAE